MSFGDEQMNFLLTRIAFLMALLLLLLRASALHRQGHGFHGSAVGVNYGRVANNLPPPHQVARLVSSFHVQNVKTFDADTAVTRAFADTGISLTICIPNEEIRRIATVSSAADEWISKYVQPYYPRTRISSIAVGNEVSFVEEFSEILLQAMQNIYRSLRKIKLHRYIKVSTPHSLAVLAIRFPPSAGLFQISIAESVLRPILQFLEDTDSPFMVNLYPYLTYKESIPLFPLDFALFAGDSGVEGFNTTDPKTGLAYTNLFDALVDSVTAAVASLGYNNTPVVVTETGWPSQGGPDDEAATLDNAAIFNQRLVRHISQMPPRGTPLRPRVPTPTFIFALFDENLKVGAPTETHWGLSFPNGTKKYDLGIPRLRSMAKHGSAI